jgi:Dolichyl-phosphate-mannose-protein mannosyltransferase
MSLVRSVSSLRQVDRSGGRSISEAPRSLRFAIASSHAPLIAVAVIVAVSATVRAWISLGVASPWILPDEVVYSDLARSIAEGGRPAVRGVPVFGWGEVYPTTIAPVWALVHDAHAAYHATLVVNALLMSLAAVPAYLLARMFVSRRAALVVSALTVLAPSMSYTGAIMTENAFYPACLFAVLAIARAVRRPTISGQVLTLGLLGVVVLTRVQGIALVAAYAGAVAVYAVTAPRPERMSYLRRFLPTAVVAVPVVLVPIVVSLARGEGVFGWLGARSGTFGGFRPEEVPLWFVALAADLVLYVAVIPAAAAAVMVGIGLRRRAPEPIRLFAAVALPVATVMLLSVAFVSASFDADGIGNLNERYVFYVVPIAFVGLAAWIESGLPRPRRWTWAVVGACCLLPAVLPIERLDYNAELQALALLPWGTLSLSGPTLAVVVGGLTLACGAVWLTSARDRLNRLWLVPAVWMALLGVFAVESNAVSSANVARAFDGRAATWVSDAVPADAKVTALWDERVARKGKPEWFYFWLMATEFFNPEVGPVHRIGPPTYFEEFLPTVKVTTRPDGTLLDAHGRTVATDYVLVTCRTIVEGDVVARAPRGALQLVRVGGPVRLSGRPGCSRLQP